LSIPSTTLFVSDLHLDAALPAASAQFAEFLLRTARSADALYILGDLFEAWIGDDDEEPHLRQVCSALSRLTGAGVACYVMHGNRDFLLGDGFEALTGCRLIADPIVIDLYGERALLTHGDLLCVGDSAYQQLRGVVRNRLWQRRFLRLPLPLRRTLAQQARAGSAEHTRATAADIMDADEAAVRAVMQACGVRTLIHGHTHRPAVHEFELDGAPARRIVLGAWYEQGSYLAWRPGAPPALRTLATASNPAAAATMPTAAVPNGNATADPSS
jgi:UDP-2,3-diacylglucosamine hydrolase